MLCPSWIQPRARLPLTLFRPFANSFPNRETRKGQPWERYRLERAEEILGRESRGDRYSADRRSNHGRTSTRSEASTRKQNAPHTMQL